MLSFSHGLGVRLYRKNVLDLNVILMLFSTSQRAIAFMRIRIQLKTYIHIQPNSLVVVDIHSRQLLDSVMYQYFDVQTVKI